jgi:hypothetical protein
MQSPPEKFHEMAHANLLKLSADWWAIPPLCPKPALVRPTPLPLPPSFLGMLKLFDIEDFEE